MMTGEARRTIFRCFFTLVTGRKNFGRTEFFRNLSRGQVKNEYFCEMKPRSRNYFHIIGLDGVNVVSVVHAETEEKLVVK